MRFHDWDILLFPSNRAAHIPLKEFRVACHVVHENELSHTHGSLGLPTMTCFVPSLSAGTLFYISIHCWDDPNVSRFTSAYSKQPESAQFEARVSIDGHLVAVNYFGRDGLWPVEIDRSFELTKSGEREPLRFPDFRRELLYQDHWNPADELGRIKIVIGERFPRDSLSGPMERAKNFVAFSFQHAPLDILENNGIAWPNPSMWQRPQLSLAPPVHPPDVGAELHTHSPRRRSVFTKASTMRGFPGSRPADMAPSQPGGFLANSSRAPDMSLASHGAAASGNSLAEPLGEASYADWVSSLTSFGVTDGKTYWPVDSQRRDNQSGMDTIMPDFTSSRPEQDHYGDTMHVSGPSLDDDDGPIDSTADLQVPTNTPTSRTIATGSSHGMSPQAEAYTAEAITSRIAAPFAFRTSTSSKPPGFEASLTPSLLNQPLPLTIAPPNIPFPASEIRSRKESRFLSFTGSNPSSPISTPLTGLSEARKFAQPMVNSSLVSPTVATSTPRTQGNSISSSLSPQVAFSAGASQDGSTTELGASMAHLQTGSPVIPLGESSSSTLNAGLGSANRARNFTPTPVKPFDFGCRSSQASPHDGVDRLDTGITAVD